MISMMKSGMCRACHSEKSVWNAPELEHAPRRADAIVDVAKRRLLQRLAARVMTAVRPLRDGVTHCTSQSTSCPDGPQCALQRSQQQRGRRKAPLDDGLFFVDSPCERGQEGHG